MTASSAFRLALGGLFAALLCMQLASAGESEGNYNLTGLLDGLLHNYDKRLRPNYGGQPVEVGVTMYVLDIASISEKNMDYTVDFYLRQYWSDPRLSFTRRPGFESISLGSDFSEHIWMPDTFIVNEKQIQASSPHTSNEFIRIKSSGRVVRSVRLSVTASCPMNLQYFPMDHQLCSLEFESYGHSMKDIRYKWNEGSSSAGASFAISLPQFTLLGYRLRTIEVNLISGNYSRVSCEFQFVRSIGYYLMQIYFPAAFIVMMSWTTFWLGRKTAGTTRVALGAITVLTMTALMTSTNAYLPKVSYLKASDFYIGVCYFMVFAALLEYATVCYLTKKIQDNKMRLQAITQMAQEHSKEVRFDVAKATANIGAANGHADEESGAVANSGGVEDKLYGIAPSALDKYSRILFPIIFVCFNLIYWVIYLHIGGNPVKDLILL